MTEMQAPELELPCYIVGVLDDGIVSLTPHACSLVEQADLIIGGTRTLALFEELFAQAAEQRDLTGKLMQVPDWIREALADNKQVVVLATGDPLCHGIASFLQSRLCVEACEVIPNLSMVQLACARLGIPIQGLKICSVHSRDTGEWDEEAGHEHGLYPLLRDISQHDQLAIYTSPDNSPDRIARLLVQTGLEHEFRFAVAERLLQADEQIKTEYSIAQAAKVQFADPNVVLLWRDQGAVSPVILGLADDLYRQRKPDKGLITKREVRAVSLARMQLRAESIVWDIGAGSGSVGLEAARLCPQGFVYAIEKNAEDAAIVRENQRNLKVYNYRLTHNKAPQRMGDWPAPDAVFVGGSGGELAQLIALCLERMNPGGWLVMNFVTFENLHTATATLDDLKVEWDITQLQASRSRPILHMHRMAAENPVWLICAMKLEE